jgi:hypothetical protein
MVYLYFSYISRTLAHMRPLKNPNNPSNTP